MVAFAGRTRTTVYKDNRQSIGAAAFLDIQLMPVRYGHGMRLVGLDGRIKLLHMLLIILLVAS